MAKYKVTKGDLYVGNVGKQRFALGDTVELEDERAATLVKLGRLQKVSDQASGASKSSSGGTTSKSASTASSKTSETKK